jgi:hypothetical protein
LSMQWSKERPRFNVDRRETADCIVLRVMECKLDGKNCSEHEGREAERYRDALRARLINSSCFRRACRIYR